MRKKTPLFAIAAVVIVTAGLFWREKTHGYVSYWEDQYNTCLWKNGQIVLTTGVNNPPPHPGKRIKPTNEANFIKEVSAKNQCWYKT